MTVILQENAAHLNALKLSEETGVDALTMCLLRYIPLDHLAECIASLEWPCGVLCPAVEAEYNDIMSLILKYHGDEMTEGGIDITSCVKVQELNVEQIQMLSPYNSRYIFNQEWNSRTQKYSVICYSTTGREGAEEEATYVHRSLWASGFESSLLKWDTFEELEACLLSHIQSIRDNCNLLFISLLSHGYRGGLQGKDGSRGDINRVLEDVTGNMHSHIPLVSGRHILS